VATRLGLGEFLNLGRSEEKGGGRLKKSLLADAVEALIAALYIDGGLEPARQFIVEHVYYEPLHSSAQTGSLNFKGQLWERCGAEGLPKPEYSVVEESGPHHQRQFLIEARIGKLFSGRGRGTTKKAGEQNAAREILERMDRIETAATS
jgi:ribonuclease-3